MRPPGYDLSGYASHIQDKVRVGGYIEALRQVVKPGSIVLDLGAGTGFFSLLACQLGAGKVHAVEPNPLVELLAEQAERNGFRERITIHKEMSSTVHLAEKADVVVADLRGGMFPLYQGHISALRDARLRLLKPEGVILPQQDTIFLAPVSHPDCYQNQVLRPWNSDPHGVPMDCSIALSVNTPIRLTPKSERVVLPPQIWAEVWYGRQESSTVRATLSWKVEEPVTIHFLSTWFKATLAPGIEYSNSPFVPKAERPNTYDGSCFPLQSPLALEMGDQLEITLSAVYMVAFGDYNFVWETRLRDAEGLQKAHFKQSTFFAKALALPRSSAPSPGGRLLNSQGEALYLVLRGLQEGRDVDGIVDQLVSAYPALFGSKGETRLWTEAQVKAWSRSSSEN